VKDCGRLHLGAFRLSPRNREGRAVNVSVLLSIFTSDAIVMIILGTVLGIIVGAIPGLGNNIAIIVMLPFTYSMSPLSALCLLGGIYMGCAVGGSFSGVLLNIPGTAESICTTLEGYPLAQKGRAKEALYLASISSLIGGVFGCIIMILFAPFLARVALKFGPAEIAVVSVLGFIIIAALSSDNLFKGVLGSCYGMLFAMVGIDQILGRSRLTFGFTSLTMGFKQVALAMGIIAGRQMIIETLKAYRKGDRFRRGLAAEYSEIQLEKTSARSVMSYMVHNEKCNVIKSAIIGTAIGIMPGAGCDIAAFVAYGEAKRNAKEKFGTGVPSGIVAPETANNAAIGGAFVPLLALGIPGSNAAALISGALTIHGIVVGPTLFTDYANVSYGFMYGLLLSAVVMGILAILFAPSFARITRMDMRYIIPPVICCLVLGAFGLRNNMFDVYVMLVFSIVGYVFNKLQIPPAPVFLGFILEPLIEGNLRMANTIAQAKSQSLIGYILHSDVCLIIIAVGLVMLILNVYSIQRQNKVKADAKEGK